MTKVTLITCVLGMIGCGPSYTDADTVRNTMAARHEARQYDECLSPEAGTCTPAMVRAHSSLAYCANAAELVTHRAPVPDSGVQCQPQ